MPSRVIRSHSYDAASRTLFIIFTSGEPYAYLGVPAEVVEALTAAPSRGRYFARHIRGRYPYRHLVDPA